MSTETTTDEAKALAVEIQPARSGFEKALLTLNDLNGAELAQAGRLGERRIEWVKLIDQQAAEWFKKVGERLAPGKKKAYDAWKAWTRLEDEMTAPARTIRERARPIIGQYQLELTRQSEAQAAQLREEQRKADEEQRRDHEEEAARIRAEAERLDAQGDTAAAEEKLLEAEYVETQPIVPVAVTAEQVARPKVDAGRLVYWRRLVNAHLFLHWVTKEHPRLPVRNGPDDSNEHVIEGYGWTLTLKFDASWKSKDGSVDIPGIAVTRGYEARNARGRK
jgi:hypothetical protein